MAELGPNATLLPAHRAAIEAVRPDLRGAPMRLHADGWDCLAIEVEADGDRPSLVFKIPHHDGAIDRLRREPKTLDLVRPLVAVKVPHMRLHQAPVLMTEHEKIIGSALDGPKYDTLCEPVRRRLASDLARFYQSLHGLDPAAVRQADCDGLRQWPATNVVMDTLRGAIPDRAVLIVEQLLDAHDGHGSDDEVFGQFDTHGWNLAFNWDTQQLDGVFDFAGAGVGPLHRDLSYPMFLSPDLTQRVVDQYQRLTGRSVSLCRVYDAHGALRVVELYTELMEGRPVERFVDAIDRFWHWRCAL
ncbi:MAG: aminoglycoside phosphotransferase family protein [Pseudomonadota bacterium]